MLTPFFKLRTQITTFSRLKSAGLWDAGIEKSRHRFSCHSVLILTALLLAGQGLIVQASAQDKAASTEPSADPLAGKTVRSIKIELDPIFDGNDLSAAYEQVNKLKISTREEVIKRELRFQEGQELNTFRVQETERVLRLLGYLRRVKVETKVDGPFVDIIVHAQDTWTLIPQFSYSSGSGRSSKSVGLAETDAWGYGKRAEVLYQDDEGRKILEGVWDDPRVLGSEQSLLAAVFDRTDGSREVLSVARPFRSLLDESAWSIDADILDNVGRLFEAGEERYIFRQKKTLLNSRYTWTDGDPATSAERYSLGYDFNEETFQQADSQDYQDLDLDPSVVGNDPAGLAQNRRFSGPVLAYERIKPQFISMNYIDRFDRVADYNLGAEYAFSTQIAPEVLGSDGNTLLFSANRSTGHQFNSDSFFRGEAGISTRYGRGDFQNTLARVELKYYNVLGFLSVGDLSLGRHTLASSLFFDYGRDLDRDREFLLGADNALRGYEARSFVGDKRLAFNLEDRVHLVDDLFKLVSVGAAAFFDGGGATDEAFGTIFDQHFYSDVGVGLRIAFPRSTGGKILRVDLAVPLRDGPDGSSTFELRIIFAGGQIFDSRLRSEILGNEKSNVAVGFDH